MKKTSTSGPSTVENLLSAIYPLGFPAHEVRGAFPDYAALVLDMKQEKSHVLCVKSWSFCVDGEADNQTEDGAQFTCWMDKWKIDFAIKKSVLSIVLSYVNRSHLEEDEKNPGFVVLHISHNTQDSHPLGWNFVAEPPTFSDWKEPLDDKAATKKWSDVLAPRNVHGMDEAVKAVALANIARDAYVLDVRTCTLLAIAKDAFQACVDALAEQQASRSLSDAVTVFPLGMKTTLETNNYFRDCVGARTRATAQEPSFAVMIKSQGHGSSLVETTCWIHFWKVEFRCGLDSGCCIILSKVQPDSVVARISFSSWDAPLRAHIDLGSGCSHDAETLQVCSRFFRHCNHARAEHQSPLEKEWPSKSDQVAARLQECGVALDAEVAKSAVFSPEEKTRPLSLRFTACGGAARLVCHLQLGQAVLQIHHYDDSSIALVVRDGAATRVYKNGEAAQLDAFAQSAEDRDLLLFCARAGLTAEELRAAYPAREDPTLVILPTRYVD
jgi:hypothetical protein